MRVAFIDQTGADAGGAEQSLVLLLRHLPPDIEPTVILFHDGAFAAQLRGEGFKVVINAIPEASAKSTRERPSLAAIVGIVPSTLRLAGILRRGRFDVVHTNTVKAHLVGAIAARLAGIPCVMHLRDILVGFGLAATRLVSRTCARERIAIASSVARTYALPKTTVIENPVDLAVERAPRDAGAARRKLGLPPDVPIVGIVGRINRWKGHDVFIRAAEQARRRTPLHCAIVGEARFRDEDFVPELHALVQQLEMVSDVTFVPWSDDPGAVFCALDVHVNASTREPFGRTVVEAAAAGVPTVCFSDAGVAEFMESGRTGIVVAPGDVSALAEGIVRYVADPAERERASAAARDWVARFDAGRHAERVAAILRRAAA